MSSRAEVGQLLATGMTNKQIARKVGISPGTVKVHLSRLYRDLGVSTRVQAALALAKGNQ